MPHRMIVCGIYRSGTSLTTRLVQEWGAYIGRKDDLFEDEYGYLEHLALQKLNDELLNNNSRVPTPVDVLLAKTKDTDLKQRAEIILEEMDKEARAQSLPAWAWKDPRLPLTLPFWADLWKDAIFIIPVRHPVETILSAAKMEGLEPENTPLSAGLAYWQFCMLNILNFTQNSARKIFISYDKLIQNPSQECSRLCNFLDQHCGITPSEDDQRVDRMTAHIHADKRHYQAPASLADLEVATTEQRALYNFLRVKTIHPNESFRPSDFALYPGWMEYLQAMDMLVPFITGEENTQQG
ncbi:MAG: sulfotransferase [Chloroflexi bacterium]|nr:sulfotransferase [Chloroflexota bacterium]